MTVRSRHNRTDWAAVRYEIESVLDRTGKLGRSLRIDGKITKFESGLNHDNYLFHVATDRSGAKLEQDVYILRKIRGQHVYASSDSAAASLRREALTLQALDRCGFEFSIPRFVCFTSETDHVPNGLIETALQGIPLDTFKSMRDASGMVLDAIARTAAAVHRVPTAKLGFLPSHTDRRDHVLSRLARFQTEFLEQDADAARAAAWIRDHAPDNGPVVFLHGDLLPQNIRREPTTGDLGVIDWEYACIGDLPTILPSCPEAAGKCSASTTAFGRCSRVTERQVEPRSKWLM